MSCAAAPAAAIISNHLLQREHVDLLNSSHATAAPPPTAAAAAKAGAKGLGCSAAAALGGNPIAALQQMQSKLDALRVRKQRITGEGFGLLCSVPMCCAQTHCARLQFHMRKLQRLQQHGHKCFESASSTSCYSASACDHCCTMLCSVP